MPPIACYDQRKYSWKIKIYHDNRVCFFFFFPLGIRFMTAFIPHDRKSNFLSVSKSCFFSTLYLDNVNEQGQPLWHSICEICNFRIPHMKLIWLILYFLKWRGFLGTVLSKTSKVLLFILHIFRYYTSG